LQERSMWNTSLIIPFDALNQIVRWNRTLPKN
jgi:hypothetical protein